MAKKASSSGRSKTKVRINFEGVDKDIKRGSSRVHIPEGDYLVKILSGEIHTSEETNNKGIKWQFMVTEPKKYKGKKLGGYTSLKPEALWSLRNLIHAATGKNVAGKALDLDIEKLYGKIVGAAVEDNEYGEGKKKKVTSQVSTCFPRDEYGASDDDDEDDDEEESDEEEDDEEEDDEEDEDLEEVEVDEL